MSSKKINIASSSKKNAVLSKRIPRESTLLKTKENRITSKNKNVLSQEKTTNLPLSDDKKSKLLPNKNGKEVVKQKPTNKVTDKKLTKKDTSILSQFTKLLDSDEIERPKTATLPKGTLVNNEKVGPEDSLNDYEDDFDSYASDFDEYSSSSSSVLINSLVTSSSDSEDIISFDKNKTSSGSEDDKTLDSGNFEMPGYKHKPILDNIKESIEKENNNYSLLDEGFEDQKSLQFVNFAEAQVKNEYRKNVKMRMKRGAELMGMVKLDCFSFTLIDLPEMSYEMYLKKFGERNTIQVYTQTGDDNVDEQIQTDIFDVVDKWTQQPQVFHKTNEAIESKPLIANKNSLKRFLSVYVDVVDKMLQENLTTNPSYDSKNNIFSKSLSNYKYNDLYVSNIYTLGNEIVTVHKDLKKSESLIIIWLASKSNEPKLIIKSYGVVNVCCFSSDINCKFIFTGLEDGTIAIWNPTTTRILNYIISAPLFSTPINCGHVNKIIGLSFLDNDFNQKWNVQSTNELCSVDEIGEIIIWTIVLKSTENVQLVKNVVVSLKKSYPDLYDLECTCFSMSAINPYYLLISTNYGYIFHYVVKLRPLKFKKFTTEKKLLAKCLEWCPFSTDYFIGGYKNGDISIFSLNSPLPLITLSDKESTQHFGIEVVRWSLNKSTVIYSKDTKNNIFIWDLDESDLMPTFNISYKEQISCMNFFNAVATSYLLIGTEKGDVHLHQLSEESGGNNDESKKKSINTFFNYVKRL